jgi:predicted MFS family arabinose efflux permease
MTGGFIVMFLLIQFLSERLKVEDRVLFGVGHLFQGAGFMFMLATYRYSAEWKPSYFTFLAPSVMLTIGLPFFWATINSMFSKQVSDELQGSGQGLLSAASSLAAILGPYWSGFSLEVNTKLTFGLVVAFWVFLTPFLIRVYPALKENKPQLDGDDEKEKGVANRAGRSGNEESTPLLPLPTGSVNESF